MIWAFQLIRLCYLSKHLQSGTIEEISRSVAGDVIILFHFLFLAQGQEKKEHRSITAGELFLTNGRNFLLNSRSGWDSP